MNILIFPSWYPTPKVPLKGIFVKEQAQAYADLNPQDNVIIAKWDNSYTHITPRKPLNALLCAYKRFVAKEELKAVTDNFYELYTPAPLIWSPKLPFGGYEKLYKNFKQSYIEAKQQFGPIDIIHAHVSFPAGYLATKLAEEFGLMTVLTEHASFFPFRAYSRDGSIPEGVEQAFAKSNQVIAVSNSLQKRIHSFGFRCQNVVPNFIEDKSFFPSEKKADKFTFFTLCDLTDIKGIDALIQAISLLPADLNARMEFAIGGSGEMFETYQNLAKELEVTNIKWLGQIRRADAPSYFQNSHAYIMLSRLETFGIVYAEATATGIPVIATKCGGPEDIVNEDNGLLVDIDNPEQAAKAIQQLFNDYHNYDSQKIRNDFVERFGKESFVKKLKAVYLKALETK